MGTLPGTGLYPAQKQELSLETSVWHLQRPHVWGRAGLEAQTLLSPQPQPGTVPLQLPGRCCSLWLWPGQREGPGLSHT